MDTCGSHNLDVRDRREFLRRMMAYLSGNARIALEGDLSACRFSDDLVVSREETATLQRNTSIPSLDFVVLRLDPNAIDLIFKQIASAGWKRAIVHLQIERAGVIELGVYDNFQRDCVVSGPGVSPRFLEALCQANVLRSFRPVGINARSRNSWWRHLLGPLRSREAHG